MFPPTSRKRTEGENVNMLIWPQVYKASLKIFKFKDFKITIFRLINIQFPVNNCAFPPIVSQTMQFFFSCTKRNLTVGLRRVLSALYANMHTYVRNVHAKTKLLAGCYLLFTVLLQC